MTPAEEWARALELADDHERSADTFENNARLFVRNPEHAARQQRLAESERLTAFALRLAVNVLSLPKGWRKVGLPGPADKIDEFISIARRRPCFSTHDRDGRVYTCSLPRDHESAHEVNVYRRAAPVETITWDDRRDPIRSARRRLA